MFINQATLSIVDALAGVEGGGACIRLAGIDNHLSARQPERILRVALMQFIGDQSKRGVRIEPVASFALAW